MKWDFAITTSSSNCLQSNSLVERNVQTITSTDIALHKYRNIPISGMDLSLSQLLMSRRLRSNLPMTETLQVNETTRKQLQKRLQKQVQYYNRGTRPLPS